MEMTIAIRWNTEAKRLQFITSNGAVLRSMDALEAIVYLFKTGNEGVIYDALGK